MAHLAPFILGIKFLGGARVKVSLAAGLLLFAARVSPVFAADLGCGRDTDQDGTVTQLCPTPDADWDGDASVTGSGTDCDDNDYACANGIACYYDATHYRLCTNGVFGASTLNTSYTCKVGSGVDRWVNDTVTDCGHAGTQADPNNYRCHFDTGMTGYAAPSGDDCIILMSGSYSNSWGSSPVKMFYSLVSGTSGHPILVRTQPGGLVTINGAGSSPNETPVVDMAGNYWDWRANEGSAKQLLGGKIIGNYANKSFWADGVTAGKGSNIRVEGFWIKDTDGVSANNVSGVAGTGAASNVIVTRNLIVDSYSRATPTVQNNDSVLFYQGTGNQITYNSLLFPDTSHGATHIFYKQGDSSGNAQAIIRGNLLSGGTNDGMDLAVGGITLDHNLFINGPAGFFAISLRGGNGGSYCFGASTWELNTIVNQPPFEVWAPGCFEQTDNTFTANSGTDIITYSNFDYPNLTKVRVDTTTTLPAPLATGTNYWTVRQSATTSKLSTTADGLSLVDITTAGTGTHTLAVAFGALAIRKNILVDNKGSAYGADGANGFIRINNYGTDLDYRTTISQSAVSFTSNDHYNTNAVALFSSVYGDNGSTSLGTTYANFAAWQASGLSTTEVSENPSLDTYNIARSSNTLNWGWRPASTLVSEAVSSTGTTTGRGAVFNVIRRTMKK